MAKIVKKSELGSVHYSRVLNSNITITEHQGAVEFYESAGLSCVVEEVEEAKPVTNKRNSKAVDQE